MPARVACNSYYCCFRESSSEVARRLFFRASNHQPNLHECVHDVLSTDCTLTGRNNLDHLITSGADRVAAIGNVSQGPLVADLRPMKNGSGRPQAGVHDRLLSDIEVVHQRRMTMFRSRAQIQVNRLRAV